MLATRDSSHSSQESLKNARKMDGQTMNYLKTSQNHNEQVK
jgi:hypothetical protein